MTRIYLDVHDHVRVDKTPSGDLASKAETDRLKLRFLANLERFGRLTAEVAIDLGRDPSSSFDLLTQVGGLRHEVMSRAE